MVTDENEKFRRDLDEMHARSTFTVQFSLSPRGRIRWEACMSGDDFLDGPWENKKSGIAKDHKSALQDAVDAYNKGKSQDD